MTFNGAFKKEIPDLFTSSQHLLIAQRIESGHQLAEDLAKETSSLSPTTKAAAAFANLRECTHYSVQQRASKIGTPFNLCSIMSTKRIFHSKYAAELSAARELCY
jgi:hypothetical protein